MWFFIMCCVLTFSRPEAKHCMAPPEDASAGDPEPAAAAAAAPAAAEVVDDTVPRRLSETFLSRQISGINFFIEVFESLGLSQSFDASSLESSQFLTRNLLHLQRIGNLVLHSWASCVSACLTFHFSFFQGCGIRASSDSGCCRVGGPVTSLTITQQYLTKVNSRNQLKLQS